MSAKSLSSEVKEALSALKTHPRKRFGQHFMVDPAALQAITGSLPDFSGPVVEIGPGLGFLSRYLSDRGNTVWLIEKDRAMAAFLRAGFDTAQFKILERDVLSVDLKQDMGIASPVWIVGNIPYNITSPILEWVIRQRALVCGAVFTMQWEVARRLVASPGSKDWGALSFFVQFYSAVEVIRKIPKGSFYPPPKVDSAAVKLTFNPTGRVAVLSEERLFFIVRKSFQKRRKTILNALSDIDSDRFEALPKERVLGYLKRSGIEPTRRSETLTFEEWGRLSDAFES